MTLSFKQSIITFKQFAKNKQSANSFQQSTIALNILQNVLNNLPREL